MLALNGLTPFLFHLHGRREAVCHGADRLAVVGREGRLGKGGHRVGSAHDRSRRGTGGSCPEEGGRRAGSRVLIV